MKIGSFGLLWAGLEECVARFSPRLEPLKETVAGMGTAVAFSTVSRIGRKAGWRAVVLGICVGGTMSALRRGQSTIGVHIQERKKD